MKLLVNFILIFSLSSCTKSYKQQDLAEDYTAKSKSDDRVNMPPNFAKIVVPQTNKGRTPASAIMEDAGLSGLSNKRIYFLTLLDQYQRFSGHLEQNVPNLRSCSHFHSTHLEHGKTFKKNTFKNPWRQSAIRNLSNNEDNTFFPELYLTLDHNDSRPTVADYIYKTKQQERAELVYKAFKIHVEKTYFELRNLCETGISANYFLFENFITHVKSNPEFKNRPDAFQSLLKLTIFSNLLISQGIQGISQATGHRMGPAFTTYELEVVNRLSARWTLEKWAAFRNYRVQFESSKKDLQAKL